MNRELYKPTQYPGQRTYSQYRSPGAGRQGQEAYHPSYAGGENDGYCQTQVPYHNHQQYNPQHYVSPSQRPLNRQHSQYNLQHYGDTTGQTSATSGPADPYAYPQGQYSPQVPQYVQSVPVGTYGPSNTQQYSPHPPTHQFGYQSKYSPPPQQQLGTYSPPTFTLSQPLDAQSQNSASTERLQSQSFNFSPALPDLREADDWHPSPPAYQLSADRQSPSPLYPTTSYGSLPPGSGPTPPAHGLQARNTQDRHPRSRPLPGPPAPDAEPDYFQRNDGNQLSRGEQEALSQEDLFQQVENAVMGAGRGGQTSYDAPRPASYAPSSRGVQRNGSVVNGHLSPVPPQEPYSRDSDAEATHGLEMLAMAEEDDKRRSQMQFRSGYGSQRSSPQQHLMPPSPARAASKDLKSMGLAAGGKLST